MKSKYYTLIMSNLRFSNKGIYIIKSIIIISVILGLSAGCKKFIEVSSPITSTNAGNVYATDVTATAVLTSIYTDISYDEGNGIPSGLSSTSLYCGLSADELTLYSGVSNDNLLGYYQNALKSNLNGGPDFWNKIYSTIFVINSAIEGLDQSVTLTDAVKKQLQGEALFMRAFCFFYLVNLYGDIPLIISTDYKVTSIQPRNSKSDIYQQITKDLNAAQALLSDNYLDGTLLTTNTDRVRPNKYTAFALLARVNLYMNDYVNAESQSTKVINNRGTYDTVSLNNVFLNNSKETIWSLQPVNNGIFSNTGEGRLFILPETGPSTDFPVYLSSTLMTNFEANDKRLDSWVGHVTISQVPYYYPYKYKIGILDATPTEYLIVMRLAEQYLIRAEARAHQGNLGGATEDLNVIRTRAGLLSTTANSQSELLIAIAHERQLEFFTEWGHRWLDLKRTNTVNNIMPAVTSQKGGFWDSKSALYPIPLYEIQHNPNLLQTPGYETN
ncbi:SusD family protein [Chitinophaga sp. CF118]|uniref:RagB/SusD family nutrient uptake outer membrane protein n=1 Tax=Chitinophaga sp. CF118 TaxID=1884367 RepID=UPI0008E9309B|nr:RagB/SusD family nutrient uptake outer membrane protein [Chitinophaga sp. CF118]SFE44956.1 SusD family protein [Chitinophaga sp. CF118]